jgi:signal transduction histidine kinase/ligand-binding sensor domain-containing protein
MLLYSRQCLQAQRWHASSTNLPQQQVALPLQDLAHMSWIRRDGAPNDITALAQTTDGYLWIGSRLGLFRFDGLEFSSYPFTSADPKLPSSDIYALAADQDGGLWIGYRMGGISYLRGSKEVDYGRNSGLISESTGQLVTRPDGSVWALADGRLMHLKGSAWENYSAKHGLDSDGLYSLFFDREGDLWTAYKGHVFELKRGQDRFQPVLIPNFAVSQFGQTPDGTVWISDAWHSVHPLNDERRSVRIPGVPLLVVASDGSIWLAHDFGGITRIEQSGDDLKVDNYGTANGLTDGQTRAILQDRQGTIWVGTAAGLDRFQPTPLNQFRGVHLDYHPAVLADKKSGIWFNDMDKPLMRLQDGKLSFFGARHGSSSLFQDSDGSVWLHDPITHAFYHYTEDGKEDMRVPVPAVATEVENWCIGRDLNGALLGCFEGHGLWRYSGTWERVTAPGMPAESPLALLRSDSGRLWIGYPHNKIVLEDREGYHIYGEGEGVELNAVLTFCDADGVVLAGGSDGLAYFDGNRFHSLHLRTSGLMRGISGIVKDRFGDLWLNGGSGVIRLPESEWQAALKDPQHVMDFQYLNERDGLIGSPAQAKPGPTAVADKAGLLWFATSGHLVSIDPTTLRKEQDTPNVLLQSVLVNGAVVPYNEGSSIVADSRHLKTVEFDYIGVDLKSADRVVYQYMFEGQDKDWQNAGVRRQAYYTNLGPGHYRFRVRAASGTGQWSELSSELAFTVKPAFYQTTWFYALCGLLLVALLWLIYRLRLRYITGKVLERMEERTRERVRIARDLHDTLLQSIQGLILRVHLAADQLPPEEPVRQTLRSALDTADQVISEGRGKVRELRAETTSARDLKENLTSVAIAMERESNIRITVAIKGAPRPIQAAVQDELYFVGREALANAVRHASATQIGLELVFEQNAFGLRCCDNGRGIDPMILQNGGASGHWGIVGMRERIAKLAGKLEITGRPGAGTEIEVRIPARAAYADSSGPFEAVRRWFKRLWRLPHDAELEASESSSHAAQGD